VKRIESNKSASSGPSMKRNGENIKRIGGGAMVPAPPSSGSTDKRLPRQMLRSGAKEGKENVVSEKNNNKPVGSKKKKRSLSTQPRSYALRDLSKRGRAQRPGREWYSDLKKFQCQDCDKSFLTESAFRRHMKIHYGALGDDDTNSMV